MSVVVSADPVQTVRVLVVVRSHSKPDYVIHAMPAPDSPLGFNVTVERSGNMLYVVDAQGGGTRKLVGDMCPLTPTPTSLGRFAQKLRVLRQWVYWSCTRAGPDTIHRAPLAGGDVQTIVKIDTATTRSMGDEPLTNASSTTSSTVRSSTGPRWRGTIPPPCT